MSPTSYQAALPRDQCPLILAAPPLLSTAPVTKPGHWTKAIALAQVDHPPLCKNTLRFFDVFLPISRNLSLTFLGKSPISPSCNSPSATVLVRFLYFPAKPLPGSSTKVGHSKYSSCCSPCPSPLAFLVGRVKLLAVTSVARGDAVCTGPIVQRVGEMFS